LGRLFGALIWGVQVEATSLTVSDRSRDAHCSAPPAAQIRTCPTTAYNAYFGSCANASLQLAIADPMARPVAARLGLRTVLALRAPAPRIRVSAEGERISVP